MTEQIYQIIHYGRKLVLGHMEEGTFVEDPLPIEEDIRLACSEGGSVYWLHVPEGYPLAIALKHKYLGKGHTNKVEYALVYTSGDTLIHWNIIYQEGEG